MLKRWPLLQLIFGFLSQFQLIGKRILSENIFTGFIVFFKLNLMTSDQPLIKIIPPNPVTHSILIVYCYSNNKTIQCQAKWHRVESFQQNGQNRNSRSPFSTQSGNTYKCSPMDFNHVIQVQAVCKYQGKQFKLVARTQPVKTTKEISQRRDKIQIIQGKLSHANHETQCSFGLETSEVLQIKSGPKVFKLDIAVSNIVFLSTNSFKARIQSNRYEFMNFFHQCSSQKQKTNHQLSLGNIFQFIFNSEIDRDLVLIKIAQISSLNKDKTDDYLTKKVHNLSSYQHIPLNLTENHINGHVKIEFKSKQANELADQRTVKTKRSNFEGPKQQNYKKEGLYGFKTPDPKSANTVFYYNPLTTQADKKQQISVNKKNQKIKISEKIIKKQQQKQSSQDICSQTHNEIGSQERMIPLKQPSIASNDKKKSKKTANQFLNIFDDQEQESAVSSPNIPFQNSSPEFYGLVPAKSRPITIHNENQPVKSQGRQDLPSINLRGSFEELEKFVEVPVSKKPKEKIKTETSRQLSYQYPKTRQKTQLPKTPPNELIEPFSEDILRKNLNDMKRQNQELKKENAQIRKQLQAMSLLAKQNNVLKKKYYELSEEVGRLQLQRKQILGDKLKWQSSYHKQKAQKQTLRKQLQQVTLLLESYSSKRKQKPDFPNYRLQQSFDDPRPKTNSNTLTFINNSKNNYPPQSRDKTPPTKVTSQNQSLIQERKLNELNSQSRKELRFPSFSYKYNTTNHYFLRP